MEGGSPSLHDIEVVLSKLSIDELCPAWRLDMLTLERLPDRPKLPDIFLKAKNYVKITLFGCPYGKRVPEFQSDTKSTILVEEDLH
jgi:hypothetical protein